MSSIVLVVRATSSANLRSVSLSPSISMPLSSRSEFLNTSCITAVNNFGDMGSPCLTPYNIFLSQSFNLRSICCCLPSPSEINIFYSHTTFTSCLKTLVLIYQFYFEQARRTYCPRRWSAKTYNVRESSIQQCVPSQAVGIVQDRHHDSTSLNKLLGNDLSSTNNL